jgi:uncharacterized protein YlxP (DUF503 family)
VSYDHDQLRILIFRCFEDFQEATFKKGEKMFIAILEMEFQLHGCRSLKEKRQRLSGLREKFGRQPQVAVCESDYQDQWQASQWTFAVTSTDKRQISQILSQIQTHAEQNLDAVISRNRVEWL